MTNAMKILKPRLALSAATLAVLASCPAAANGAVIPPGNSAATQYTEAIPTPGGDKKTDEAAHHRSPVKVLGDSNTRKLRQQGRDGQAAAETAAATAPAPVATETPVAPASESQDENATGGGSSNSGGKGNGGDPAGQKRQPSPGGVSVSPTAAELSGGSSGIGSAFEQATGLSSAGQSGMLLPLVILVTILCSLAYLWRQRRQVD
jgi:hypothetical protein